MPCDSHDHKALLREYFDRAVEAVSAERVVPAHLPDPPAGRTVLLAVGKAAAAMADVAVRHWEGPISGLAVTRYGHALDSLVGHPDIEVIEAGHPIPDQRSIDGARRALALVDNLTSDDLVLVLISGGGSALWCLPIDAISLDDKQRITYQLLSAGASIGELNTVRKWLSGIKGGKLAAAAAPARVETLIISDVVHNDPGMIASGPTVPRTQTFDELQAILARYDVDVPAAALESMRRSAQPAPEDTAERCSTRVVAVPTDALAAAEKAATRHGFRVDMLGDDIEGEASKAAAVHAALTKRAMNSGGPTVILSGGEVTVAVHDRSGIGGPNTEFLLALALALDGADRVYAIACDTDGYDGIGQNAGAIIGPDTLARARELGLDPRAALAANDSSRFFDALGDLVVTGPTQTNVSDFRAIMICGKQKEENPK